MIPKIDALFTQVSLLDILFILGIPYIIFYFYHLWTKFDYFPEKWEAAIFLFSIGGSITMISSNLKGDFYYNYFIITIAIVFILVFITKIFRKKEKDEILIMTVIIDENEYCYQGTYGGECKSFLHLNKGSDFIYKIPFNKKTQKFEYEKLIKLEDCNTISFQKNKIIKLIN